jgi:hypothetical protein
MNDFPGPASGSSGEDERVRRLLHDAVSDVEPREGLDSIHARTTVTPFQRRRPWVLGAGAAVLATAATVAAVTVMGGNAGTTDPEGPGFAGSPTGAASATSDPSPSASSAPSATTEPSPSDTSAPDPTTVPVYYVGDTSRGPRLFREFHSVSAEDPLLAAVDEAVATQPDDADYRSPWPDGTRAGQVGYDGDVVTVSLEPAGGSAEALRSRPAGMSAEEAGIAVEQLVYTAQAALQQGRPPVQFLIGGERTDMLLGVPVSEPVAQADPLDVLAQVWVIDPAEGAEVTSPFEVSGVANAFEANVQWELMQGDTVIEEGFTTAEEAMRMAPYSFTVTAPPGDYTLVVHDSDPSGGEGPEPWQDTKQITVTD